ncbi:T9SS type A sorting domain-containing protein [Flavobacterium sp.]|uniref:T9SS type A sorting domain-containing protein n=1 Tax=Flavobacterium sp. TaxID=239 RepID=UPI00286AFF34|nr:T9SS type A sorting domain-containing protein [Flavobacterium sp.]
MKKSYFLVICLLSFISNAQTIDFPDYHFSNKLQENVTLDLNNDGQVQVNEAQLATSLVLNDAAIYDLTGIEYFTNLESLNCSNNVLTSLNLSALIHLRYLSCDFNQLTTLDLSMLPNLEVVATQYNPLTSLNISGLNLTKLWCYNTNLTQVDVSGMTNLTELKCYDMPQVISINASGATNLSNFYINIVPNLNSLNLSGTSISELNLLEFNQVNNLQTLNVSNCTYLTVLRVNSTALNNLNIAGCAALFNLSLVNCPLTTFSLVDFNVLYYLTINNTLLTHLDLSRYSNLREVNLDHNALSFLDFTGCTDLFDLSCQFNQLPTLNVSTCPVLYVLNCSNNVLTSLYIKNGSFENGLNISNNPNLSFICVDANQIVSVQNNAGPNVTVVSDCVFSPSTIYNTIAGSFTFDQNQNGCDASDGLFHDMKVVISDNQNQNSFYTDASSNYSFYTNAGTFTVVPQLENPTFFTVTPESVDVPFSTPSGSVSNQNFCIAPNGVHPDLEILLLPLSVPRPGYNVLYRLTYKNKGNTIQNGTVDFSFNDAIVDFVSATPELPTQTTNHYNWSFSNLQPFEQREITVMINLNSGSETPSVFFGDSLTFSATVASSATDESLNDNNFILHQIAMASFDPNDKRCLEGDIIDVTKVGDYVHYMIRFENTGNANADNIVVRDAIDLSKFDLSTLVPLTGSHAFVTKILDGNKVEFVFENINLPYAFGLNQGYVVFKIKTKSDLVVGDSFTNTARIYFDYNLPIITNTATTSIQTLGNQAFEFSKYVKLYPNPAHDILNLQTKDCTISSINIYNTLGQLILVIPNAEQVSVIDISSFKTGNYFIKINSDKGTTNAKFAKN